MKVNNNILIETFEIADMKLENFLIINNFINANTKKTKRIRMEKTQIGETYWENICVLPFMELENEDKIKANIVIEIDGKCYFYSIVGEMNHVLCYYLDYLNIHFSRKIYISINSGNEYYIWRTIDQFKQANKK